MKHLKTFFEKIENKFYKEIPLAYELGFEKYGDWGKPFIVMFHTSHQLNRESILANGLDPRLGVSPWYSPEDPIEYPIGVYLWFTLEEAIRYGQGNGDPFDVWKVTIAETEMMPDPITKGATYVSRVEASSVKLVYSSI